MDPTKLKELKLFIEQCKSDPSFLADPSLSFFRDYIESLGAKLPESAHSKSKPVESDDDVEDVADEQVKVDEVEEDKIIESDVELEGETVEPDDDPPQKMGDLSVEVTEESRESSQSAKAKAMEAISEGSFRIKDEQGDKVQIPSVAEEKKPEKASTPAPSMKKTSTFTDKKPEIETSAPKVPPRPPTPPPPIRQTSTIYGCLRQSSTGPNIGETKADEWEKTELEKIRQRYEKLKETIDSWENKKKVKARSKLTKQESELERRRLKALKNFQNKMKYINQIAEGARAKVEENRKIEELKAKEKANAIRTTGKLPRIT